MTKKKYYNLLGKYQDEIELRNFNKNFASDIELEETVKVLITEIKKIKRTEIVVKEIEVKRSGKLNRLQYMVENYLPITEEDYSGTYSELTIYGMPFKWFCAIVAFLCFGIMFIMN